MPSTTGGFRWNYDQIRPSLKSATQKGQAYLAKITTYHAMRSEAAARVQARWRDRTSNARNGLTATANNRSASSWHFEYTLYHKVTYGIWLEIRWGGKWGIIRPTLKQVAPEYWQDAQEVLQKMFGS